ncbi:transglutaminase domain-containing protein [Rhizosphaericola mali]|uniref:DUF3857 domain-containing protein n=1 Tax=Rhizosphaericola mali TaxID=2545455 RepID=A0A5P2G4T2_9BACT|nr:transglutaminase domain-containing protein [Rhizosphaericola mali]QES90197.1 hypothetical protein E0W69_016585 [Rhizosphaericola mali]
MTKYFVLLSMSILFVTHSFAQSNKVAGPEITYGNVKVEDFKPTAYEVDSSAEAVYLFDRGNTYFQGNNQGFFSLVTERIARIRIMKKSGYDIATVIVPLYVPKSGDKEKLISLQAVSYNVNNGQLEKSAVEKDKIYHEQSGNFENVKFTFPNIKEGSIIEYKYKTESPYFSSIDPWYFQGGYPRVWSEFEIELPTIFDYRMSLDGYRNFDLDTFKQKENNYSILVPGNQSYESSHSINVHSKTVVRKWGMQNVKVLKNEPYISSLENYTSKISFQLSSLKLPDQPIKNYMHSWQEEAVDLNKDEDFGHQLQSTNRFLDDDLKDIPTNDSIETVKAVFRLVQNSLNSTDKRSIWLTQPIKETWKLKKGSVADINILLTAAMRRKGISADPVILGTRDHIRPFDIYPIMNRFNYVLCRVNYNGKKYFLDASDKHLGFNQLNSYCYNGPSRTINEQLPELVYLSPDSITEKKSIFVNIDPIGNDSLDIGVSVNYGNFESQYQRDKVLSVGEKKYLETIENGYTPSVHFSEATVDSIKNYDMPLSLNFKYKQTIGDEDIYYFNPIVFDREKDNPFKTAERSYPVEFTAKMNQVYYLNMTIPEGYEIDEMPKSARVKLFENEGMFEYLISTQGKAIQLKCTLRLDKATFSPEDYNTLRDFYGFVVKKESEPIVLKKKKN